MSTPSTPFVHRVGSEGPAQGAVFAGRVRVPTKDRLLPDAPLVVAIHGGGYTSGYFDVPGYSLLERAEALDIPIIAVDRPGYGGSEAASTEDSVFLTHAASLDHLIAELWSEYGSHTSGVVLIGHSFGAVVAMAIAARQPNWPLLGIALSGCLQHLPDGFVEMWSQAPDWIDIPDEVKANLMFGREWTRRADMPHAAAVANVPVMKAELIEVGTRWTDELLPQLASRITVPVHLRHGEFDALWRTDASEVAAFAARLTAASSVDAQLFGAAGHAIDYERGGAALQVQQLGFALDQAARLVAAGAAPA